MVGRADDAAPHLRAHLYDLVRGPAADAHDGQELGGRHAGSPGEDLDLGVLGIEALVQIVEPGDARAARATRENRLVAHEGGIPEADPRLKELVPDPLVEPDAARDLGDIGAGNLADV